MEGRRRLDLTTVCATGDAEILVLRSSDRWVWADLPNLSILSSHGENWNFWRDASVAIRRVGYFGRTTGRTASKMDGIFRCKSVAEDGKRSAQEVWASSATRAEPESEQCF